MAASDVGGLTFNSSGALLVPRPSTPPSQTAYGQNRTALVLAAGDIASCGKTGASETAALLKILPGTILALGDLAYSDGTPADYSQCFEPTWGPYKADSYPHFL